METVLIILAIVWVVIPILAKSKQKQAAEQAERERLARQRAAQAPLQAERARSVAQPVRTSPLTPNVGTSGSRSQSSFEGVGSLEGRDGPVFEGEEAHEVATTLKTAQSSLTQLNVSADHEVAPSSISGHAHEETSMNGINASCPPDQAPTVQVALAPSSSSAESAFVWDPANVRSGLVLAEILGPCVAMRE